MKDGRRGRRRGGDSVPANGESCLLSLRGGSALAAEQEFEVSGSDDGDAEFLSKHRESNRKLFTFTLLFLPAALLFSGLIVSCLYDI